MAKKKKVDVAVPAEAPAVEAPKAEKVEAKKDVPVDVAAERAGLSDKMKELVTVIVKNRVKINGQVYQGRHKVPKHVAEVINQLDAGKSVADLESALGSRNFLVERLSDGTRIVKRN